jgi:cell division protein FtsA
MKRKTKSLSQPWWRSGLVGALDVGTTKISCLIARLTASNTLRVIGVGHQSSNGLKGGALVDLEAAEERIRATVDAAERMAGERIRHVIVNVSAGQPRSRLISHEVVIPGHEIGDAEIRRVLDPAGFADAMTADHELLHVVPVSYSVDDARGVRDPRGMFGQRLGVNLHIITAASGSIRNLSNCVARCHLEIAGKVLSPYAAAIGTLVEEEKNLGVTLIDMGGGTTSVAVYFDSQVVHTEILPVGGNHVTRDLARCLSTPIPQAERIKTLYGSCQSSHSDGRQMIEVPPITDDGMAELGTVPREMLVRIIFPRMEEIFEMVRARLEDAGFDKVAGRRAVLTGGACQLPGAADLAGDILNKRVRIGRPRRIDGLPEAAAGTGFAVCVGLLEYAMSQTQERLAEAALKLEASPGSRWTRLGQWLRENF